MGEIKSGSYSFGLSDWLFGYAIDSDGDNWGSGFVVKMGHSDLARSAWRWPIGCQIEMSSRQSDTQIRSSQRHIEVEDTDILATWTTLSPYRDSRCGMESKRGTSHIELLAPWVIVDTFLFSFPRKDA